MMNIEEICFVDKDGAIYTVSKQDGDSVEWVLDI